MFKKKVICAIVFFLFLGVPGLFAGDTATFVDLGFSPDGSIYMFGQYGVQSGNLRPWADLFVVDVARNSFVPNGRLSYVHDNPVVAGQNGIGALHRLIAQNAPLAERHSVDYSFQGQPLFISLDNTDETIEFRDFDNGVTYRATLVSLVEGEGENLRSSFFINLESISRDGLRRAYTVGSPQLRRPLISSYDIQRVMIAPMDGAMIFVIKMRRLDGDSFSIRYMVEAVRF